MSPASNLATVHLATAFLLLLGVSFTGCCSTAIGAGDVEAIRTRSRAWLEAAKRADHATLAGLYAEDAVLLPPNAPPVRGRLAIQAHFAGLPPISGFTLHEFDISGSGDFACVWGGYELTIAPPGAKPIQDRGHYVEIWRRRSDGVWCISRDTYASDLPPPR